MINEVFTSINKLFNSNFYNLSKDELINLHKILSSKWTAFLDACRGSILGLSKPVKYVTIVLNVATYIVMVGKK